MIRAERSPQFDDPAMSAEAPKARRWGRILVLWLLAVVLVGGGAWAWLAHGKRLAAMFASASGGEGIPLLRADPTPFKVRPRDPGGMEIPDRDKLVYERLQGAGSETRVERLLPPPEAPIRRPAASDPARPVKEPLPRVPSEAQVLAAKPPPAIDLSKLAREAPRAPVVPASEPTPEDSPPTDIATAPASPEPNAPDAPPAAAPAPEVAAQAAPAAHAAEAAASAAKAGSGYLIQIAAVREPERAEVEWERLQKQHPESLRGLKLFVARADLGDKGVFWRLRAGPFADEAAAKNRCAELASRRVGCLVVKAQG